MARPIFALILARTDARVIGCNNALPWRMRSDLRRFREVTLHRPVIMGRRTLESIGRPLPDRENIILTRNKGYHVEGTKVFHDAEDAANYAREYAILHDLGEIMVIGGEEIFRVFRDVVQKVYLTEIHDRGKIKGDAYFDFDFENAGWKVVKSQEFVGTDGDQFPSTYKVLEREVTADCCVTSATRYLAAE